jgi:tetratricopeptide (TPR) repeat protein
MRRFFLFLSFIFLFCVSVQAQESWTKAQTKNFTLIGNGDEFDVRMIGASLEQFREAFTRISTDINFTTNIPTIVIVFKDNVSYNPFKVKEGIGYFQTGEHQNYITLTTETTGEQNPYMVVYHEYTHLLVINTFGRDVPVWFGEGFAEYYGTFKIKDERSVILGDTVKSHLYQIKKQGLLSLKTLFSVGYDSPYYNEGDKRNIFYAQSWLLLHYLIQNEKRMSQLKKFLELLKAKAETEKAFTESFQMSYTAMEELLLQYATKKDAVQPVVVNFENKLNLTVDVKSEAIEEGEAFVYLSDLLSHNNAAVSGEYLKKAVALAPKSVNAQAALGIQKAKGGNYTEAKIYLQRAVEAGTKNHLAHYYYAESINAEKAKTDFANGFTADELKTMRVALKRAIELEPKFVESYRLFAFINLIVNEQLDESVELLIQGLKLSPNNEDLIILLAQCYLAKSDFKNAKETLEKILRTVKNEVYKAEAQRALNSLRETELSVQRGQASMKDLQREMEEIRKQGFTYPPQSKDKKAAPLQVGLREPKEGEKQVRGQLIEIQCQKNKSVLLVVKSGDAVYKFFKSDLLSVDFVTFTARFSVGGEISCGAITKDNKVVATYRPNQDPKAKHNGEIVLIEFIPKDFPT